MKTFIIPLLKLFILFIISSYLTFRGQLPILLIFLITLLITIKVVPAKIKVISRLKSLLFIGVLVVIFQIFFNYSIALPDRIISGISASLKIIDLSLLVFFYTSISSINEIISVFSFLPSKMQLLITITFSLIPAILGESEKIIIVQKTRGHKTTNFNILNNFLPVVIPLLHRTLKRAEQLSLVILSRGYNEK